MWAGERYLLGGSQPVLLHFGTEEQKSSSSPRLANLDL